MARFLCWFLGHDWPDRSYEVCDIWETYGVWYLTAKQQCRRTSRRRTSRYEQCPAERTVRVLTHKECPR